MKTDNKETEIKKIIREKYGNLADKQISSPPLSTSCGPGCSCCKGETGLAESALDLYANSQLDNLPDSVTGVSLGCGNPSAIADLKTGDYVLDLGSGGGIDCFIASKQVGETGRIIGLDMTPKMLDLARANAKKQNVKNVEFRYGYIEDIPLLDNSVDVILSNCVINLSTDKDAVFRESHRVLKPGGRFNISDIVTEGKLSKQITDSLSAWAGCMSGALEESVYIEKIQNAGFSRIEVVSRKYYSTELLLQDEDINNLINESLINPHDLEGKIYSITLKAYKE